MKFRHCAAAILVSASLFPSCKKSPPPQAGPINVTTTPVIQEDVTSKKQWVGLLDGFQNASIQAQVTGYLLTQNYKEGSDVKKGATLFTIDPRPFEAALAQAQAQYASALARAQLEQITLQRQTELYRTKVISEQEYQTSYQNTQAAIANVAAAQAASQAAQVNLDYCTIQAPFDGVVGVAQAQIGDLVGPGGRVSTLTQASQIDPMKMNFFVTEAEYLEAADLLARIQKMPTADKTARLSIKLADGSTYPEHGMFDFFNRQINTSTGTIQITGLFPNPTGILRPGLFATVTAPVEQIKGALLIPQKAAVEVQGNYFVSIVQADNTVRSLPIKLGPPQGALQVVTGNLAAGDNVIVEGVEKIRGPGVKVNATPYKPPTAPTATPSPAATK